MSLVRINDLVPDVLSKSEKNSKDLEKLLLQRALIMKDDKIRNLEMRIACLKDRLDKAENAEPKLITKETVIINNNIYSNMYCCGCSIILILGIIKLLK